MAGKPVKKAIASKQKPVHNSWGNWVERPRQSEIHMCSCGNKYLKTRKGQSTCIRCILR